LNDELTFLKKSHEFIWGSARDGYTHLYLYDTDGHLIRQLTAGNWVVDDFRKRAVMGIDENTRTVYFSATEKSPTERHLYRTSLDTADPHQVHQITQEAGVHGISMSPDVRFYIDNFTSASQPPQVSLRAADGTLKSWLLENRLDAQHPDAPYVADNSIPEIRHPNGGRRPDAVLPIVQAGCTSIRPSAIPRLSMCTADPGCSASSTTGTAICSPRS
jgi:dipeptidyl-peptidase-4